MPSIADVVERYGKQKYLAASLFFFLIADAFFPGNRLLSSSVLSLMIITEPLATSRRPNVRRGTIALAVLMVGAGYLASLGQQPVVGSA